MIPRLYSDLHREFDGWDIPVIEGEQDMTLILAGDIAVARRLSTYGDFLVDAAARHKHVVYVPGNHEYYGDSFSHAWEKLQQQVPRYNNGNIHFLQGGEWVEIGEVMVIGATLWTDMGGHSELTMLSAGQMMNDYRAINRLADTDTDDGWAYRGKLQPHHTVAAHKEHVAAIDDALYIANQKGYKTLVVTHHGPTLQSVSPRYVGDILNGAYVSDLSELIRERAPTAWVHGHVHDSMNYVESKTLVVANPKGYPNNNGWRRMNESPYENENFREDGLVPELVELFS